MFNHTIPTIAIILGILLIGYAISLVYEERRVKETKRRNVVIDKMFYVMLGLVMVASMVGMTSFVR